MQTPNCTQVGREPPPSQLQQRLTQFGLIAFRLQILVTKDAAVRGTRDQQSTAPWSRIASNSRQRPALIQAARLQSRAESPWIRTFMLQTHG